MKNKLLLVYLLLPSLLLAQPKPRNPVAPSGSWATDLIRAYVMSTADSADNDSVKDWSPQNVVGIPSGGGTAWINANLGTDAPGFRNGLGSIQINAGHINGLGITDQLTIVQRLAFTDASATVIHGSISLTDRLDIPDNVFKFDEIDTDNDSSYWCVNTGTEACVDMRDLGASGDKITIIATYAGDSIRVWVDGSFKGAAVQTGNLTTDVNYTLSLGLVAVSGQYINWFGVQLMTLVYKRVLTSAERSQIWADSYVMFKTVRPDSTDAWGKASWGTHAWGRKAW